MRVIISIRDRNIDCYAYTTEIVSMNIFRYIFGSRKESTIVNAINSGTSKNITRTTVSDEQVSIEDERFSEIDEVVDFNQPNIESNIVNEKVKNI